MLLDEPSLGLAPLLVERISDVIARLKTEHVTLVLVDILRTRLVAFVIGAFFSAIAGALWAHMVTAVAPAAF